MKSRRVSLAVTSGALSGVALLAGASLLAGPAAAEPPMGGPFQHSHHVHTGDGGCVDISAVLFNPDHRGLHQGSNASGPERGPWHGTCDSRLFPGGPTLVSLGLPVHH